MFPTDSVNIFFPSPLEQEAINAVVKRAKNTFLIIWFFIRLAP